MAVQRVNPKTLHPPFGTYSHSVRANEKTIIAIAGQVAVNRQGKTVGKGDAEAQARQIMRNIGEILKANGATFADVMKINIYLTDVRDLEAVGKVRTEYFKGRAPASTMVAVTALAVRDLLVEIEAWAAV